jgi:hypothetical protein
LFKFIKPCSFGLSATSQQYFSLRTNQPPAISQQYFSLRINQHQPSATSQQYFSLRTNQPPAISQQYFSLRINQHQPSATSQTNRLAFPDIYLFFLTLFTQMSCLASIIFRDFASSSFFANIHFQ